MKKSILAIATAALLSLGTATAQIGGNQNPGSAANSVNQDASQSQQQSGSQQPGSMGSGSMGQSGSSQSGSMGSSGSMDASQRSGSMSGHQGHGSTSGMGASGSMQQGKLSPADRQFAEETAMCNRAELELSKVAAQKASNPSVKQFAQMMMQDHGQGSSQLTTVSQQKGMKPPTDVPEPDKRMRDRLQEVSGQQVDMMYMKHMYAAHMKDLTSFQLYAQTGQDPDLKRFANSQVPVLQQHLRQAESILSQMGVTVPSGSMSATK